MPVIYSDPSKNGIDNPSNKAICSKAQRNPVPFFGEAVIEPIEMHHPTSMNFEHGGLLPDERKLFIIERLCLLHGAGGEQATQGHENQRFFHLLSFC